MIAPIDESRLARLADDLDGDLEACGRAAREFSGAWEGRITLVRDAIGASAEGRASAALLSISTTGRMLGAEVLAAAADRARGLLALGALTAPVVDELDRLGRVSLGGLEAALLRLRAA
ncbi:MAG: hypothetical protein KDB25_11025 [Leucobacter sp.]|nr:hypothetical protein [Leucobacter sp.]